MSRFYVTTQKQIDTMKILKLKGHLPVLGFPHDGLSCVPDAPLGVDLTLAGIVHDNEYQHIRRLVKKVIEFRKRLNSRGLERWKRKWNKERIWELKEQIRYERSGADRHFRWNIELCASNAKKPIRGFFAKRIYYRGVRWLAFRAVWGKGHAS